MSRIPQYFFLFIFLLCPLAHADLLPNGIYSIIESGNGTAVKTFDGSEVHLAERFTAPIEKINFRSISNNNEKYSLSLEKTGPFSTEPTSFALYVDGYCLKFNGSGSNGDGTFDISGQFDSSQAADAFAKFLKAQPLLRVHPNYALATKYTPSKKTFSNNEPVSISLEIKNVGSTSVTFEVGGKNRGERDNQFHFTAYYGGIEAIRDTGSPVHFGGLSFKKTLNPGEIFTKEIDLRKWFTFQKSGTYEITGVYDLSFFDPVQKDYFVVWEDYATAKFYLRIE